ncbi:hypothetical protein GOP47_0012289 [Adiantum capillus-veneris]|uniref:Peroxisomal adenine nucleotide carrier 1 n=1 Tax=Adiantum capillus-veneris TaxID=13818 RepID=A0A9D4URS1_ADICA|nr:hypothetical protein GOP47_0012289 [Adiantum capillus-veneris]
MGSSFEDLTEATSGAIGGVLSTSILYPLDTCKTKYQAEARDGQTRKYRSSFDVLAEARSSGQLLALYQGIGTKIVQSFVSQFIYFYSYSFIKNLYLQQRNKKRMGTGANLVVAAAAGACTVIITQPLDTASSRMQTSAFGKSQTLWRTLKEGGWRQAYDGLAASLLLTCNPAIQYTVYEQLKGRILRSNNSQTSRVNRSSSDTSPLVLSALSAFLLGALSKTIATVITYPAIRCKVILQASKSEEAEHRMQASPANGSVLKSMFDAMRIIWHKEGGKGFYKGLQAQIIKTILSASIMLMIKEKTSKATWVVMLGLRRWLTQHQGRIKVTQAYKN